MLLWRAPHRGVRYLWMVGRMIPISEVRVTQEQEQAVMSVLRSGQLAMGQHTRDLEVGFSSLLGGAHCVAVANGTVGLTLALAAAGVEPGREVVTTSFSFIGTIEPIVQLGASPVFVDVDLDTANIDVAQVEAALSERTAAIVPVHLYGRPVAIEALRTIANRWGVPIIEDACQAIGARHVDGSMVGSSGIAVFSFYGSKNVTCGEGGLVATSDPEVAERLRLLRNHGSVTAYEHRVVGYNGRMTDIQAALLQPEVDRIDAVTRGRRAHARQYDQSVNNPHLVKPRWSEVDGNCWHQYTVRTHNAAARDDLQQWAKQQGVETRVYYPTALPALPVVRQLGFGRSCPRAEALSRTVVSFPVRESLSDAEVARVSEVLDGWRPNM